MNITINTTLPSSDNSTNQTQERYPSNYIGNHKQIENPALQLQVSEIKVKQCKPQNIIINLHHKLSLFVKKINNHKLLHLYEKFIKTGDINIKTDINNIFGNVDLTLLHYAVLENDIEITVLLLEAGADVNATTNEGETPLHRISWNKNPSVATLLIQYGADIHAKDNKGDTPLHKLWENKNKEIVKELIKHNVDVKAKNNKGKTLFDIAAKNGNFKIVSLLLKTGNIENINLKNKYGNTALHHAISFNNIKATRSLILKDADVNIKNNKGETPLNIAARENLTDIVELLLSTEKVADINTQDIYGKTPLHYAVDGRNTEMCGLLLDEHINVDAKDLYGNTPLHYTVLNRNTDSIIEMAKKIDIYKSDLYSICLINDLEIAKLLVERGANINTKNNVGDIPLYYAKAPGTEDLYKLLTNEKYDDVNATHF